MASEIILLSFSVFVVLFLGVGAFAAKRSAPTDVDYLLGSRSFGTWFVGLSAGATGNSGFIMLGAVAMGYTMGLSGVILGLAWFLGDLLFWNFFPEKFNRIARDRDCSTIPELLSSGIPGRGSVAIRQLAGMRRSIACSQADRCLRSRTICRRYLVIFPVIKSDPN